MQVTFLIAPGNSTVTELRDALNAEFIAATMVSYHGITVSYDTNTNKYMFTDTSAGALVIDSTSTMKSVLGFETGEIDLSVGNTTRTILNSNKPKTNGVAGLLNPLYHSNTMDQMKLVFKITKNNVADIQ